MSDTTNHLTAEMIQSGDWVIESPCNPVWTEHRDAQGNVIEMTANYPTMFRNIKDK